MALRHYREGLKYDPEHKDIKTSYRQVKKLEKLFASGEGSLGRADHAAALADFDQAVQVDPAHQAFNKKLHTKRCKCHLGLKDPAGAHAACDAALSIDDSHVEAVVLKAEAHGLAEEYDEAVRTWQRAHELDGEDNSIREGFQRAQAALKQS